MKLGELLAARREYLNLSQQEVATAIGTNKSTISRYETGDISNMRRDRIYKLANVLNLSTKVIMNWQDDFFIAEDVVVAARAEFPPIIAAVAARGGFRLVAC